MDVERVQGRGRSTLIPFSEARKHGSEVSHGIAFKMPDVDVGHGCGKETIVGELLAFLSEKIEMKFVQGIWRRNYEYLKSLKVRDERKLTSIPNKKHLQSAFQKLDMGECKESVSPKLDKAYINDDSEELDEEQT